MSDESMGLYILEHKTFRKAKDIIEWGEFMSLDNKPEYYRHVRRDYFFVEVFEYCDISTVFLGIDHAFGTSGPVLFESMIFGGEKADLQHRYPTWDQAEMGHKLLVAKIDTLIKLRHNVRSVEEKKVHEKASEWHYSLTIPAFIPFDIDDIRLVRED